MKVSKKGKSMKPKATQGSPMVKMKGKKDMAIDMANTGIQDARGVPRPKFAQMGSMSASKTTRKGI